MANREKHSPTDAALERVARGGDASISELVLQVVLALLHGERGR